MQYKPREFASILRKNGYKAIRTKGSHQIWYDGKNEVVLPLVNLNAMIAKRIIKEYSLHEK